MILKPLNNKRAVAAAPRTRSSSGGVCEHGGVVGVGAVVLCAVAMHAGAAHAGEFAGGAIETTLEYKADYVFPLAGAPNDVVSTLQGVDNIEVDRHRLRLYEFWVEAAMGEGSVRAGLYDLNSEFYATESAGLLIAPAFGIGSEIAATSPNGPSIFPSTALAVRVSMPISKRAAFMIAVINAEAGVLGDPDGVDTEFEHGVLAVSELTWSGDTNLSFGAWSYTDRQDDIRDANEFGDPVRRRAFGGYATIERRLVGDADSARATTGFLRVGFSDGDTTPYSGGWQPGLLIDRVLAGRPRSALSVGINQGILNNKFRANALDLGEPVERSETQIEITYSDMIGPVMLQPDLQLIPNPGVDPTRDAALVATLRFLIAI